MYTCGGAENVITIKLHSLFARFRHLRGEPQSQAQICAHCGAYAVKRSLDCVPVSLSALHASGTAELMP